MDIKFRNNCVSITPSKTFLVRVTDNDCVKCLGTYSSEEEAVYVADNFRRKRLARVCGEYAHKLEDGVIVEQYYILFDNGDIFVTDTARKLKPGLNGAGYLFVRLNGHIYRIHRLVAENFIPKIPGKTYVNHIDGNKLNNDISNLEWCTQSENVKHAFETGLKIPANLKGEECPWSKLTSKDVQYIREHYVPRDREFGQYALSIKYGVCQQTISNIVNYKRWKEDDAMDKKNFLYPHQKQAIDRMFSGCILNGGVGSGKSRTALYWYFSKNGGKIENQEYFPMRDDPPDLYIISTAKKKHDKEWESELVPFLLYPDPETKKTERYGNKVVIDSWNVIKKYTDVVGAVFIFDEDKVCGKGAWAKAFLKIAKNNEWIILSASPGDVWQDYETVFIANGFFRNRTEFRDGHLVYSRFSKYPDVIGYRNETRLIRLRNKILIDMDFMRHTTPHHEDIYVNYDTQLYRQVMRNRFDPYKQEPIEQASGLCYVLRRVVNSDVSRQVKLLEIFEDHPRMIIFYSFDYELEILKNLAYGDDVVIAEYNGHVHEAVPKTDRWVYLVNYTAGAEGFNCITTNCIVFYSQTYSYKTLLQAAGRIDRLNTPYDDLYYYHLKSRSTIDLAIAKALRDKKKFNERRFTGWKN